MVVVELQYSGRASPSSMEEEEVLEREREAPRLQGAAALPPTLLYIGPQGGRRPWRCNLPRGAEGVPD